MYILQLYVYILGNRMKSEKEIVIYDLPSLLLKVEQGKESKVNPNHIIMYIYM